MLFVYKGFDKTGKRLKARIEASDLEDAKRRLKARGVIYESIKEAKPSLLGKISLRRKPKLPAKKLAHLSRNLAIYLRSGIPIVNVIRLAKTQYETDPMLADFLASLESSMDEGKSFYAALEAQQILSLPSFYKQSIKVAEESGSLAEVLFEMARFVEEQEKVSGKVKQALVYPLFIVVVSIFMVAFMLTSVVPKITKMFDQLHQTLPAITRFVIAAGDFLGHYWLTILVTLLILSLLFGFLLKNNARFRYGYHRLLLKLPLFGKIIQTFELARFSYITAVLTRSGVTFVHAVKLGANILDNEVMKREFQEAAREVVEGKKFSNALARYGKHVDRSFIQAVALGEETSEVALVMENMADLYFEENRTKIDLFLSLLEPVLILFVGVTIGFIVIAMLLPIFSMNLANM